MNKNSTVMKENGTVLTEYDDPVFGKCQLIYSSEFVQDQAIYFAMIDNPKTGPILENEVTEWHQALQYLDKFDWNAARKRIKFLKEDNS